MVRKKPKPQDDIAIVGLSCIFPAAEDAEQFWHNVLNGVCAIGQPPDGWGVDRHHLSGSCGRVSTIAGGFLRELYRFDASQLGVMPSSIDGGEPDQFLALKVAREALADAGYLRSDFDHARTGIILGHSTYLHRGNANVVQHGIVVDQTIELLRRLLPDAGENGLEQVRAALLAKLPPFNADVAPGLVPNVMTGRIANRLNLNGPNYLVDAACASSLVALHAAREELRSGRADLMLAGGVNAAIPAEVYMVFTQLGALSRSSQIQPFSAGADGTLLGEGLGIVVLKRLQDALRDRDRVYAVVKAIGQSSDGRGAGLLAPRLEGEILAFKRAYEDAEIAPSTIGLVEAHGTGIPLGDRTEIAALTEVLGARQNGIPSCAIGSVKSMIGHCIPAAGVAGLIKAALALYHKVLPPTLCEEVSPQLGIERSPFYINTETRPWIHPHGSPRRAGVNAFGFGGINSHAVLEEAPETAEQARPRYWPSELIVMSGESRADLISAIAALLTAVEAGRFAAVALGEVAKALAERPQSSHGRLAIVAESIADLASKLAKARELLSGGRREFQMHSGVYYAERRLDGGLAFLFPGEGAQYQCMLDDLLRCFPEARWWFDFWDAVYEGQRNVRPSQCVFPPPTTLDESAASALRKRLFGIEVGSESVFIADQALLAVLRRLGLRADAVVGHSSGEHSALLAAGALPEAGEHGLKSHIQQINRLYNKIEAAGQIVKGALLTVGAVERDRVLEVASGHAVHLALDNCHHQAVLFGSREAIEKVAAVFRAEGGLCSSLPLDRPYHTPLFTPVTAAIERIYGQMRFECPSVPVYSCATAAPMPEDPEELARLAATQWSSRVRFTETVERMHADGIRFFVEVGPSSNLTGFVRDILQGRDFLSVAMDNRRRSSVVQLLHGLGRLWVQGRNIRLAALFDNRPLAALDVEHPPQPPRSRDRTFTNTLPYITFSEAEAAELRRGFLEPATESRVKEQEPAPGRYTAVAEEEGSRSSRRAEIAPADIAASPAQGSRVSEIVRGHFEMMRDFLAVQERVVGAALSGAPVPPATASVSKFPFLRRINACERDSLVAECRLSVANDTFLRHHVLYAWHVSDLDPALHGLPVVPLAVSMEMVAEAAAALAEKPYLVRLENVQAHDWIALDMDAKTLRLSARRLSADTREERISALIEDEGGVLFQAEAIFADEVATLPPTLPQLAAPRRPTFRDDELYTSGMFHGPLFQAVRRLVAWDEGGLDVELGDSLLDGFLEPEERPSFLLNPVLMDTFGHVTAFWIAQHRGVDFSSFPSRIDRIDLCDASEERTAGCVLGGRLSFQSDDRGTARYLCGEYECRAPDGRVLLRASGWRDRFFEVPHRFYHARFNLRDGWYGEDCTMLFPQLPQGTIAWYVPAFPLGFFNDAGGIWKRVLAQTILAAEERDRWEKLPGNANRKIDWLMGRLALKEVTRRWIQRHYGALLLPADLVVRCNAAGKPYIAGDGLENIGQMPEVSVAHSQGHSAAVAAPPGQSVGIDLELTRRVPIDDVIRGAFAEPEHALIADFSGANRIERVVRMWCAKEAAAKCHGEGLNGRPRSWVVGQFASGGREVHVSGHGRDMRVTIAAQGEAVMAIAFA